MLPAVFGSKVPSEDLGDNVSVEKRAKNGSLSCTACASVVPSVVPSVVAVLIYTPSTLKARLCLVIKKGSVGVEVQSSTAHRQYAVCLHQSTQMDVLL